MKKASAARSSSRRSSSPTPPWSNRAGGSCRTSTATNCRPPATLPSPRATESSWPSRRSASARGATTSRSSGSARRSSSSGITASLGSMRRKRSRPRVRSAFTGRPPTCWRGCDGCFPAWAFASTRSCARGFTSAGFSTWRAANSDTKNSTAPAAISTATPAFSPIASPHRPAGGGVRSIRRARASGPRGALGGQRDRLGHGATGHSRRGVGESAADGRLRLHRGLQPAKPQVLPRHGPVLRRERNDLHLRDREHHRLPDAARRRSCGPNPADLGQHRRLALRGESGPARHGRAGGVAGEPRPGPSLRQAARRLRGRSCGVPAAAGRSADDLRPGRRLPRRVCWSRSKAWRFPAGRARRSRLGEVGRSSPKAAARSFAKRPWRCPRRRVTHSAAIAPEDRTGLCPGVTGRHCWLEEIKGEEIEGRKYWATCALWHELQYPNPPIICACPLPSPPAKPPCQAPLPRALLRASFASKRRLQDGVRAAGMIDRLQFVERFA